MIAGSYRSGSTWMFNAVRLLAEESGLSTATGEWNEFRGLDLPEVDVLIVKEHRYFQELADIADVVFTSRRNWADVEKSYTRFTGIEATPGQVAAWRVNLRRWQESRAHKYCMAYNLLASDPEGAFNDIAMHTPAARLHKACAWAKLQAIRSPAKGYDPVTFMFHNHITQYEVLT